MVTLTGLASIVLATTLGAASGEGTPSSFTLLPPGSLTADFCFDSGTSEPHPIGVVFVQRDATYIRRGAVDVSVGRAQGCPVLRGSIDLVALRKRFSGADGPLVIGVYAQHPGPRSSATNAAGVETTVVGTLLTPLLFVGVR
jgi:hypothetical protein